MPLSKPKSKATKKMASSFVGYFARLAPDNATKLERNERKRAEREPAADAARHAIAAKKACNCERTDTYPGVEVPALVRFGCW